jgi:hypothetical protein
MNNKYREEIKRNKKGGKRRKYIRNITGLYLSFCCGYY